MMRLSLRSAQGQIRDKHRRREGNADSSAPLGNKSEHGEGGGNYKRRYDQPEEPFGRKEKGRRKKKLDVTRTDRPDEIAGKERKDGSRAGFPCRAPRAASSRYMDEKTGGSRRQKPEIEDSAPEDVRGGCPGEK